jgi:hypothetical protein
MMFTKLPDPTILAPYLSAFDCVLKPGKTAIYCSSELTSGQRWNRILAQHDVRSSAALKDKLGAAEYEHCYQMNMETNKGWSARFAKIIRYGQNDGTEVIDPGPLKVPDWKAQDPYYAFWETLIRSHVREVRFNEDWQYSNGCTYEFAVAFDERIPTLDSEGTELNHYEAVGLVRKAVIDLKEDGFDVTKLREHLQRIESLLSIRLPEQGSPYQDRPNI